MHMAATNQTYLTTPGKEQLQLNLRLYCLKDYIQMASLEKYESILMCTHPIGMITCLHQYQQNSTLNALADTCRWKRANIGES